MQFRSQLNEGGLHINRSINMVSRISFPVKNTLFEPKRTRNRSKILKKHIKTRENHKKQPSWKLLGFKIAYCHPI